MIYVLWTVLILISPLLAAAAVWYQKAYIDSAKPKLGEALKAHKKLFAVMSLAYIGMAVYLLATRGQKQMPTDLVIQNLLLWDGVVLLAVTDYKVKKIPNAVTLLLLGIRCFFMAWGILVHHDSIKDTLLYSLVGMLFGGGFILICMIISKGGIGAGDLKIFAVIGLYFGLPGLVQVMLYSLMLSAFFAIGMLIFRKAKMKSTLPMAPFILVGLTVYYILLTDLEIML
ncbi:MAG: prepilin peptidase [Oscillospiraceae bacterium]|nr:prepilin peptidase [Oscillospiraceae bacterium]